MGVKITSYISINELDGSLKVREGSSLGRRRRSNRRRTVSQDSRPNRELCRCIVSLLYLFLPVSAHVVNVSRVRHPPLAVSLVSPEKQPRLELERVLATPSRAPILTVDAFVINRISFFCLTSLDIRHIASSAQSRCSQAPGVRDLHFF